MEGWALIAFWVVYLVFFNSNVYSLIFAALYTFHYINRSFIFPLRTNTKGKQMPLMIALSATFFNSINASSIGYYLSNVSVYNTEYFIQWNFVIGNDDFNKKKAATLLLRLVWVGDDLLSQV